MLISMSYIKDAVLRINNLSAYIQKVINKAEKAGEEIPDEDFSTFKSTFYGIATDMLNALCECAFALDSGESSHRYFIEASHSKLKQSLKEVRDLKEINSIISILESITFPYENYNYGILTIDKYKADFRYSFPSNGMNREIDDVYYNIIGRRFSTFSNRAITILDIHPLYGNSISAIKKFIPNTMTYAACVPEYNAPGIKRKCDKIAIGSLRGSTISNDAFDIVLVQPPLTLFDEGKSFFIKKEKDLIRESFRFIRGGGYMVLAMPYFKFYKDICLIIAKNFTDIQVRKISGSDFERTGVVFVTAKKKQKFADKEPNQEDYQKLRYVFDINRHEDIHYKDFDEMKLPELPQPIELFRGSILDTEELNDIFLNSPCVESFWKSQEVDKIADSAKRPLLPFNTGQLGLVLTSGCLDGIVDEGNGYSHIVKGRVVKKTDSERDYISDQIEVTETTSNRVEINVLLPDGTHKVLA